MKGWTTILGLVLVVCVWNQVPGIANHLIGVYGNASLGYYYINIYVGTPPQEQSVIIDTGSGQLAIPCSKCTSCGRGHIHPPFDVMKSKTNKILTCASQQQMCKQSCSTATADTCKFSVSYAQGSSLSGIAMQDYFQFQKGSVGENIQSTFGCTTRQTKLFYTQAANGIFGLAPRRNSKLLEQLYQSHSKFTHQDLVFSICLSRNGGQLSIGGMNKGLNSHEQSIKTTFSDSRNVYSLNFIGNIKINTTFIRQTQDLGYYGLFIDSGATFTYFKYDKFKKLQTQLQNICAYHSNQCLVAKSKEEANCFKIIPKEGKTIKTTIKQIFSPIDIEINGKIIRWTSDKYFVLRSLKNKEVCLAIYGLDRFLLGANWMVDRNIAFNLRQKTVEIYPEANCLSQQRLKSQQLSLYTSDETYQGPLDYVQAIIHQDDFFLSKLIALIVIILIVFGLLILVANNAQGKVSRKEKFDTIVFHSGEDESESSSMQIKSPQNIISKDRQLSRLTEEDIVLAEQRKANQKQILSQKAADYINQANPSEQVLPSYEQ